MVTEKSCRALYLLSYQGPGTGNQLRNFRRSILSGINRTRTSDHPSTEILPSRIDSEIKRIPDSDHYNPDMLLYRICPNHQSWSRLTAPLTLCSGDEAHMYRGVFGSHVACSSSWRLRRLCELYARQASVYLLLATIANHVVSMREISRLPFTW
jgi:DEAD/DEAH box helicase domain-containing protein